MTPVCYMPTYGADNGCGKPRIMNMAILILRKGARISWLSPGCSRTREQQNWHTTSIIQNMMLITLSRIKCPKWYKPIKYSCTILNSKSNQNRPPPPSPTQGISSNQLHPKRLFEVRRFRTLLEKHCRRPPLIEAGALGVLLSKLNMCGGMPSPLQILNSKYANHWSALDHCFHAALPICMPFSCIPCIGPISTQWMGANSRLFLASTPVHNG